MKVEDKIKLMILVLLACSLWFICGYTLGLEYNIIDLRECQADHQQTLEHIGSFSRHEEHK